MAVLLLMTGCRSIQYVPVQSIKHDSIYLHQVQRDSIHLRDSVYLQVKGDTVFKYQYRYLYRTVSHIDTVLVNRVDTIAKPYRVEIEKKLTFWQEIKVYVGGWALLAVGVLGLLVYILIKKKV
jgi:hypothetical protein